MRTNLKRRKADLDDKNIVSRETSTNIEIPNHTGIAASALIPTLKVSFAFMASVMLAAARVIPFYPKPISLFSILNRTNIANGA